jgi:hypothetical protein
VCGVSAVLRCPLHDDTSHVCQDGVGAHQRSGAGYQRRRCSASALHDENPTARQHITPRAALETNAALQGACGRQALPGGGLLQASQSLELPARH